MQRWSLDIRPPGTVHSWGGSSHQPEGLVHGNFELPLEDNLLWVYEGMTRYLGDFVVRGRAGFGSPEFMRDYLAFVAAQRRLRLAGRAWHALLDTAIADAAVPAKPCRTNGRRSIAKQTTYMPKAR